MPLTDNLIELSSEAIVGVDAQLIVRVYNRAAERLLGYPAAEVIGQSVDRLVPERLIARAHNAITRFMASAQSATPAGQYQEWLVRHRDGTELTLETSACVLPDGDQFIWVAFIHDISTRKQQENDLRKLSRAVDQSPSVVVITDVAGRIEYVNPKFTQITGYTLAEVRGQNPRVLKSGETPTEEYGNLWATILAGGEWRGEFHNKKKNGELYWEAASISPIFDAYGTITHFLAVKEDITARKAAEQALRRSEASNRALINALPDLIFQVSRSGVILDYTGRSDQILFAPPDEFLGRAVTDVMPPDIAQALLVGIDQALNDSHTGVNSLEYQLALPDGPGYYEARFTPSGPHEVLVLVRDITQRMQMAEAERQQRILAEALRDTVAALNSSLDLDDVLERILDNVGRVVPHDAANIMLIDDGVAKVARAHGYLGRGLHDWVMALAVPVADLFSLARLTISDSAILISNTQHDANWVELPQTSWVRSYLAVPIRVHGETRGFLNLDSATPDFFTPVHAEHLIAFANQAALAVSNAQLLDDTRRQAQRERLVNQITNRIRGTMDLNSIIQATVEELGRLLGASRCLIRLGADADYMPIAHEFVQPGIERLGDRSSGLLVGTRSKIMAHTTLALNDTRSASSPLYRLGIRAILATPIMVRSNLLGALIFHECERPRRWQADDIQLVEAIAAQVGIAIENARLYHETRRQLGELAILHTAAIATAESASLTEALRKVAQSVYDALGNVNVAVMLTTPGSDDLSIRAGVGYQSEDLEGIKIKIGQGVTGWVAQTGQPALVPDVRTDPRYLSFGHDIRSELCVPLRTGTRIVGVLNVESRQLDAFTERDLQLLTTLSHNLTIIIENIRLLEEVRDANGRLKELDRLKSQFLANMSHELRTPLNAIIGFSELIGDGVAGPLTTDQREYAGNINSSGRHLLTLINDILDLSKIQAGRMQLDRQDVTIAALVAEVQPILLPLVSRKQQRLLIQVPADLPELMVDPLRIKQVLINLLSNACKFTPEGGQVVVRAQTFDTMIVVSVSDTGRGIPPSQQATIFEEFRQVEDSADRQEGTGLGLAIARHLIELHGGRIWVESSGRPGLGSTFSFTLPSAAATSADEADRPVLPLALIIEDDIDFSDLLALHLRQASYRTRQCFRGDEALNMVRILQPALITLDMVLPEKDGWTILRELRSDATLRTIPVLVISAQEQAQDLTQSGEVEYVPKPLLKHTLVEAIDRLADRSEQRPLRVLVTDDDPMLIELLHAILQPPNFELTTAINGAHAIEQITRQLPDLIILDLLMPDMSGFELLSALRSDPRTANLPALVLTAKSLSSAEQAELDQAAQGVLTKTQLRRDRLLAEIKRLQLRPLR